MSISLGTAVGYLMLDHSGFSSGLKTAEGELSGFQKSANKFSSAMSGIGTKLTSVGTSLTKNVTTPIVGLGTAAAVTAANFESAMSKVKAISGSTGEEMTALRDKAIEMGAKTKFSAKESADAFTYMAMAGWKASDMVDGISGIMSLAAADGLDLATTSDIVTDALTAFGLQAKDSSHFADVLAQASSSANTNVSMLGESFKYVAPVAGAMNMSVEDTALALGIMANSGIKASQAGTALRSMLTRISTDAGASSKSLGALGILTEKLGVEFYNTDGSVRDLSDVLVDLRKAWKGLTAEEQNNYAKKIAGQEAISGFLALMNTEESEFNKLSDAINNCNGRADEMAETMMDNTAGAIEEMTGAIETLAINLGTALTPTIRKIAVYITDLAEKLGQMNEEQMNTIVKIAAIVAAVGPCLIILGKLFGAIGSIVSTVSALSGIFSGTSASATLFGTTLGTISAPVLAVVAIIGVLIAAFKNLWDNNEEFREKFTKSWNEIKNNIGHWFGIISKHFGELKVAFGSFLEYVKPVWDGFCELLGPVFLGILKGVGIAIDGFMQAVNGVIILLKDLFSGNWSEILGDFEYLFANLFGTIQEIISTKVQIMLDVLNVFLDWFGTSWQEIWDNVVTFFKDVWNGIVDFFKNIWTSITEFFTTAMQAIVDTAKTVWNGIATFIDSILNGIKNVFITIWGAIKEFLTSFWNNLDPEIKEKLLSIKKNIEDTWAAVKNCFTTIWNAISTIVSTTWNNIKSSVSNKIEEVKADIDEKLAAIKLVFSVILLGILSSVITTWNNIKTNISDAMERVSQNISSKLADVKRSFNETVTNVVSKVTNFASNLKSKATEAATGFYNNIVNGLKNLPTKMGEIGAEIVNGLWNGISNGWKWLKDKVSNLANELFEAAKDALDIHSPSRKFAWLAKMSVEGYSNTFTSAWGKMKEKLQGKVGGVTDDLQTDGLKDSTLKTTEDILSIWLTFSDIFDKINYKIKNAINDIDNVLGTMVGQYGELKVLSDGSISLGYVGYGNKTFSQGAEKESDKSIGGNGGNTFNFYSQTALSEADCVREFRKTQRKIDEGL